MLYAFCFQSVVGLLIIFWVGSCSEKKSFCVYTSEWDFNRIIFCLIKGVLFMKRNVLSLALGLLSCFVFFSCLDDDDDGYYVSYGVVRNMNSTSDYEIYTDKGNTLVVTKSQATGFELEDDKRVLVYFDILSEENANKNVYEIRVNYFFNLLSKPIVNESFILQNEEARRDSIGDDPFSRISAWFGGDFINIDFEVWHAQNSDVKHMINLVYDDTRADADTVYLRLYHNAFGEVPKDNIIHNLYQGIGKSSFKVSDLLPENVSSKPFRLSWTQYDSSLRPIERSGTLDFKKGETESDKSLSKSTGIETSIAIK